MTSAPPKLPMMLIKSMPRDLAPSRKRVLVVVAIKPEREEGRRELMDVSRLRVPTVVLCATMAGLMLLLVATAETGAFEDCKGGGPLISKCQDYVKKGAPKREPSKECCNAIQGADLPCLCKYLTPEVANLIDIELVCNVGRRCGVAMPDPGTKCGSKSFEPERKLSTIISLSFSL